MTTIYEVAMATGRNTLWRAHPMTEIVAKDGSRVSEARWRLEFEDTKNPVVKHCRARIVRSPDGSIAFENDPGPVRVAYRLHTPDGKTRIEGDVALWDEMEHDIDYF